MLFGKRLGFNDGALWENGDFVSAQVCVSNATQGNTLTTFMKLVVAFDVKLASVMGRIC